ncbi:MAG TPA: hypothetical protein VFE50_07435 [Cyclobacteriaceae bacterium]|nr:hypothetical protein [Cyclobacteriaceae bacterium]
MVEVFKTNVTSNHQAKQLVNLIEDYFDGYKVNFDLEDCDHILRVEADPVEPNSLIGLLKNMGVRAEVLCD